MRRFLWTGLGLILLSCIPVHASSFDLLQQAAARSHVPTSLMLAIAWVESRGVLTALNVEGDAFYPKDFDEGYAVLAQHADRNVDVGVMQVNVPTWSPRLKLSSQELYQPRTNLPVAAYVLRQCIDSHKGDLWKGVGCYHSPRLKRQRGYVQKVWAAYNLLRRRGVFGPALVQGDDPSVDVSRGVRRVSRQQASPPPTKKLIVQEAVPIQTTEGVRTPQDSFPTCPGNRAQVQTIHAKEQVSLVFFSPQYGLPVTEARSDQRTVGRCVGCSAADLDFLNTHLSIPIQEASQQQLQELNVTCLPMVVQMVS